MKRKWCFLWFLAIPVVTGCGGSGVSIEERTLSVRNQTNYEFNASIDAVITAVINARGEQWNLAQPAFQGAQLAWRGDGSPFAKKAFIGSSTNVAAFLYGMGNSVGTSKVYLKDSNELRYYADFNIQLTPVDTSRTRVDIITQKSQVLAGTEWHPYARAGIFVTVEPTSIEEYQILLDIGKQLGIQDMPQMILPDTNAPTLKRKKSRSR
ncbi:MAG: hypothetical protein ABL962_18890 [Fimbriimonadaceae bacterium]